MEVPCRLRGPQPVAAFQCCCLLQGHLPPPCCMLFVSCEGTCLPGPWIHQCSVPREQCCLPHTGLANPGEKAQVGAMGAILQTWNPDLSSGTTTVLTPVFCSGLEAIAVSPFIRLHDSALGTVPVPWMGREPSGPQGLRSLRWPLCLSLHPAQSAEMRQVAR